MKLLSGVGLLAVTLVGSEGARCSDVMRLRKRGNFYLGESFYVKCQ